VRNADGGPEAAVDCTARGNRGYGAMVASLQLASDAICGVTNSLQLAALQLADAQLAALQLAVLQLAVAQLAALQLAFALTAADQLA
jgi:hypothetical protein